MFDFANNADSYKPKTFVGMIIFFVGKIFLVVIFFNLVISVVGDSYDKVMLAQK